MSPGREAPAVEFLHPSHRDGGSPVPVNGAWLGMCGRPGVVLRFDDGYQNNLTIAAPILAERGMRGTLYTGLASSFLGSQLNGFPILTGAEVRKLHAQFGWEIGSHSDKHQRWDHASNKAEWVAGVRRGVDAAIALGLPRPVSFAYPNGQRALQADDAMARIFDHIGMVGEAESIPMPYNRANLMTGWQQLVTTTPENLANSFDRIKRYVVNSLENGWNAVLAFHGVSAGGPPPPLAWFQDQATFTKLMDWLVASGAPIITQRETLPLNLVRDAGFWDQSPSVAGRFGSFPWLVRDSAWVRTARSDGGWEMCLSPRRPTSTTLAQSIAVEPGRTYAIHWEAESRILLGSVRLELAYRSPVVNIDSAGATSHVVVTTPVIRVQANGARTMSAIVTVPNDYRIGVADVTIRAINFVGQHTTRWVGMWDSREYDPIRAA